MSDHSSETKKQVGIMQRISEIAQSYQRMDKSHCRGQAFEMIQKTADEFIARRNAPIEVAVVGEVKAGKSTLINALLGARLASTDATPETSTLVKYHTTNEKNYIRISFYTSAEWEKVWESAGPNFREEFLEFQGGVAVYAKNLYVDHETMEGKCSTLDDLQKIIMPWISKNFAEHYFVKELEVGYCGQLLANNIVLVDTPGLNDPVAYRSEITKNYIQNADWVLACIPGSETSMCKADTYSFLIDDIRANLRHPEQMMIVATGADKLSAEHRNKLQSKFLENMEEKSGQSQDMWKEHFVFASPLVHLLQKEWLSQKLREDDSLFETCLEIAPREFGFKRRTIKDLNAAELSEFQKRLGVENIKQFIEGEVQRNKDDYDQSMEVIRNWTRRNLCLEFQELADAGDESRTKYITVLREVNAIMKNLQEIYVLLSNTNNTEE